MESKEADKIIVGVTGGIGTGKTTICKIIECLGYPVYYADDAAKSIMSNDQELIKQIKLEFGAEAYHLDGSINRVYMAREVFGNASKLEKLNALVHPAVARDFHRWTNRKKSRIVFKEAALIFETGSYKSLSYNLLVLSPLDLRLKRLLVRDNHRTKQDILNIIDRQMSDDEKVKLASYVIHNDEQQSIIKQVLVIVDKISKSL